MPLNLNAAKRSNKKICAEGRAEGLCFFSRDIRRSNIDICLKEKNESPYLLNTYFHAVIAFLNIRSEIFWYYN